MSNKIRAGRNRTQTLTDTERERYKARLVYPETALGGGSLLDKTICGSLFDLISALPDAEVDLLFADPPYNMDKKFNGRAFNGMTSDSYELWLNEWLPIAVRKVKSSGSIYICGDWRSSTAIQRVLERNCIIRNRITWEREKGRGASRNWKNCSEDIWFATISDSYTFNVNDVLLKRKVLAPYTSAGGAPKDWKEEAEGRVRETHPSNLWTDLTVPFWSMPENTDHPTQKPEKLLAKIILASTNEGDIVFDPFLGSGTTSVVAKKLKRRYIGIEIDEEYCLLAEKRLHLSDRDVTIQGYQNGVFWERNSVLPQNSTRFTSIKANDRIARFEKVKQTWLDRTEV